MADERSPKKDSKKVNSELNSLESLVKGALTELTDLESNILNVIKPSAGTKANQENNYLMAVRRFQNAMKVAILDGANKRDLKTFEEGFNFYKNALDIMTSVGNQDEIDRTKSEFAQLLFKILTKTENSKDNSFIPFATKACMVLAEIYDSTRQFNTSLKFHNRTGDLLTDNPLVADIEYFQAYLNALLVKDIKAAEQIGGKMKLKLVQAMSSELIQAYNSKSIECIEKVKTKMGVLGAQRSLDTNNINFLLDAMKEEIEPPKLARSQAVKVPKGSVPLSSEKVTEIKSSLTKGIQQLQAAHPNITVPPSSTIPMVTAKIDTKDIVNEIRNLISTEISKEIKSLSNDIVTRILSSIPSGGVAAPQARSGGPIVDDKAPSIQVVEGGPREKPKRPKLDDMLDSVIVSE